MESLRDKRIYKRFSQKKNPGAAVRCSKEKLP